MATSVSNALSTQEKLIRAREAAPILAQLSTAEKNLLLEKMAKALESEHESIRAANQADLESSGLQGAMRDRLLLTPKRIAEMSQALRDLASLPHPAGEPIKASTPPNALHTR